MLQSTLERTESSSKLDNVRARLSLEPCQKNWTMHFKVAWAETIIYVCGSGILDNHGGVDHYAESLAMQLPSMRNWSCRLGCPVQEQAVCHHRARWPSPLLAQANPPTWEPIIGLSLLVYSRLPPQKAYIFTYLHQKDQLMMVEFSFGIFLLLTM